MTIDAETLARALGGKRRKQWLTYCQWHPDKTPSLLIFEGHTSVQVRCRSGCHPREFARVMLATDGGKDLAEMLKL